MYPPRRVVVACDKFKGSLDASEACAAVTRGISNVWPETEVIIRPIADGGEGFAETLAPAMTGRWVETVSCDALGRPVSARYWLADDGPVALVGMAESSGMWRIQPLERDILSAHTAGTGLLMRHAAEASHARSIIVGLGGSATNDGGAGMATALGVRFFDDDGRELDPSPASLSRLARCETSARIALPPVTAACDVDNPLLGPRGASRVFGPQKGADENNMPILEEALRRLCATSDGQAEADQPGAGAAGGLGFGLLRFAGAKLVPGFPLVAGLTRLEETIRAADLVITGEGSLDHQSLSGKGPVGIARLAAGHGVPVWGVCGRTDEQLRSSGTFTRIGALADTGLPLETLIADAARLVSETIRRMASGDSC